MDNHVNFEEKEVARSVTQGGYRYDYAYGRSMLCDRMQGRFVFTAALLCAAAAILVFYGCYKTAANLSGMAVILIWLRPMNGCILKELLTGESCVIFYEDHCKWIRNSKETVFLYSNIRRITDFGQRVLIEEKKVRLLLSADGFEGMSCEEFLKYVQEHFPAIPVRQKKLYPVSRNVLRLVLVTLLLVGIVISGAFFRPRLTEEVPQTYQESSLLCERPLTTYDLDLFSISLPMGLLVDEETDEGWYMERLFYSNYENTCLRVAFEPKGSVATGETSKEEYAQMVLDAVLEDNGVALSNKGISRNTNGNPCFTARIHDVTMYCVVLESEFYFAALTFMTDITQYTMYQPHFEAWEASISINTIPTGSILNQQKTWSFGSCEITVPSYFANVPTDTRDVWLWSPQNDIDIQIMHFAKNSMNIEEAFLEWLGEEFDSEDIVTSPSGNPSCVFTEDGYIAYTCCIEGEAEYIAAIFSCEKENYAEHIKCFRNWEETIVVGT